MSARLRHLVRRFVQTVKGREPTQADLDWVAGQLSPAEYTLFERMTPTDQAHAVEVARLTSAGSGGGRDVGAPWIVPAALLHDIGKVESGAGIVGRVVATLLGPVMPARLKLRMQRAPGWFGAIGRHLAYPALGSGLLGAIGSHEYVRAWAAEHHDPSASWTVPFGAGRLLSEADDRAS